MFESNSYPLRFTPGKNLDVSMELIFLIIIGVWLLVLSVVILLGFRFFTRLAAGVKKDNLIKILDKILKTEARNVKEIGRLEKEIEKLADEGKLHVQKVGLVRFNPFDELGGDHSFSLGLLDGKDSGIILTGLHTRERTRVYIKHIKKGKSKYALSDEEKKALTRAQKGRV